MEKEIYNWATTFDTAAGTMTHVFSDRVQVVFELRFGLIITVRDGEPVDKFAAGDMTVGEYSSFLSGMAITAEALKQMRHG